MKTALVILLLSCLAFATCAPAESRMEHDMDPTPTHAPLTASDLHPLTPILLADLDETIPALVVIRERAMTMAELEQAMEAEERERVADREHTQAMNTEAAEDDEEETAADDDDDDGDALIESDFEISAPYGGYGGYGGYGKKGYGGLGYGGYGSKKVPYKKVPYKKVPYKKVPFKKGPPKKKAPPKKKLPPKKKGGFGGYGGFGFGGFKKGGFGYGGGFGGHH